jgi:hypothetical protein
MRTGLSVILRVAIPSFMILPACSANPDSKVGRSSSYDAGQSSGVSPDLGSDNPYRDGAPLGDIGNEKGICPMICEQAAATGPEIESAPYGEGIAAIQTLAIHPSAGWSVDNGCTVSWSGWLLSGSATATSDCKPSSIDASPSPASCAQFYQCPSGRALDGGLGCMNAWINLLAKDCQVTVFTVSGRQETFKVVQTGLAAEYDCHTASGECVHVGSIEVSPNIVVLSSSGGDGGTI